MKFRRVLQRIILELNRWPGGYAITSLLNKTYFWFCAFVLFHCKGVISVYARGSYVTRNMVPGLSDFDFMVVISELNPQELLKHTRQFNLRIKMLNWLAPLLKKVYTHTRRELMACIGAGFPYYEDFNQIYQKLLGPEIKAMHPTIEGKKILAGMNIVTRRYLKYLHSNNFKTENKWNRPGFLKFNHNLLNLTGRLLYAGQNKSHWPSGDAIFSNRDSWTTPEFEHLLALSHSLKENAFFVRDKTQLLEEEFKSWFYIFKDLAERFDWTDLEKTLSSISFHITTHRIPPSTLSAASRVAESFTAELEPDSKDFPFSCALSSFANKNYAFKFYIVVSDSLPSKEFLPFLHRVKHRFQKFKHGFPVKYFSSMNYPIIIPEALFRKATLMKGSGLEPEYFSRYGMFIHRHAPDPLVIQSNQSPNNYLRENEIYAGFLKASHPDSLRKRDKFGYSLIDYISGTLPSLRLALEHNVITTTPAEAMMEYQSRFHDDYSDFLNTIPRDYFEDSPELSQFEKMHAMYLNIFPTLKAQSDRLTDLFLMRFPIQSCSN